MKKKGKINWVDRQSGTLQERRHVSDDVIQQYPVRSHDLKNFGNRYGNP